MEEVIIQTSLVNLMSIVNFLFFLAHVKYEVSSN
jgi:hypothetical protein